MPVKPSWSDGLLINNSSIIAVILTITIGTIGLGLGVGTGTHGGVYVVGDGLKSK